MTAPMRIDPATLAAAARVQALVDDAVRLERIRIAALERDLARHERLHKACRRVANASDALAQARFSSAEPAARKALERECGRLKAAMGRGK